MSGTLHDIDALYRGMHEESADETSKPIRPRWALTCTGYIGLVRHALDDVRTTTSIVVHSHLFEKFECLSRNRVEIHVSPGMYGRILGGR